MGKNYRPTTWVQYCCPWCGCSFSRKKRHSEGWKNNDTVTACSRSCASRFSNARKRDDLSGRVKLAISRNVIQMQRIPPGEEPEPDSRPNDIWLKGWEKPRPKKPEKRKPRAKKKKSRKKKPKAKKKPEKKKPEKKKPEFKLPKRKLLRESEVMAYKASLS